MLRALQLGDLLCAVPAFRALRNAWPRARITLIGLPWASEFAARYHAYLDDFLEFPGYPGLPERSPGPGAWAGFLRAVRDRRFDFAIQMHGNGRITNSLVARMAPTSAGFVAPGGYCPDPKRFLVYPQREHEVRRLLRLMAFLGVPARGETLTFPLSVSDRRALERVHAARGLERGGYVCIHPGGRSAEPWPTRCFAEVADALAQAGLRIVLTGIGAERPITRAVGDAMASTPLDLSGRTCLGALGALIRAARLVVCGDTGISHLAAALSTPSVVIFTTSDPAQWAPLDSRRHRTVGSAGRAAESPAVIREADALLVERWGPNAVPLDSTNPWDTR